MEKPFTRPSDWPSLKSDLANLEYIAFEGAGVTGILYTGALHALHAAGLLDKVKCFAGTSSGSIVATAAALGYRGATLENIAMQQDFKAFCRTNHRWWKQRQENFARDGIFSGGEIRRWINNLCARRIGQDALSFADLEEYRLQAAENNREFFEKKYQWAMEHKDHFRRHSLNLHRFRYDFEMETAEASINKMMEIATSFRSLEIAATEIIGDVWLGGENKKPILFNAKNSPNLTLASAVRASASYPYYFRHAHIEDDSREIRRYTDGGFTQNIPMSWRDSQGKPSNRMLGFASVFIDKASPTLAERRETEKKASPFIQKISHYLKDAIATTIGRQIMESRRDSADEPLTKKEKNKKARMIGHRRMKKDIHRFHVSAQTLFNNRELASYIIPIDRLGIDAMDFDMTLPQKRALVDLAYQTVKKAITGDR